MPMGLRSSAMCCQRITNAIRYIYQQFGFNLVPYLDDLATAETPERSLEAFQNVAEILKLAGLEESIQKAHSPSIQMVFLGIQFDTMNLTLSIPIRVQETLTLLDQCLNANEMSPMEIQLVVGKLQFLANCVRPGRLFMSRILEFMRGLPDRGRFSVTDSVKADMWWWKLFLPRYNGISLMAVDHWSLPDKVIACDACLTGCGAWFHEKREYFH